MTSAGTASGAPGRTIDEISDDYVERSAALDPEAATFDGVAGHESRLTDYSPDGEQARADLARQFLRELAALAEPPTATQRARERGPEPSERDRRAGRAGRAGRVMRERLEVVVDLYDADEHLRDLSTLFGPVHRVRGAFDLMPTATEDDWSVVADRMEQVPWSLETARTALDAGLRAGTVGPQRLAHVIADQAQTWAGSTPGSTGFFSSLVQRADASPALRARLDAAAASASQAYATYADYLLDEYAPRAASSIGVGADRYALRARAWTGDDLDLDETYAWGWAELARILARMGDVAARLLPGEPLEAVIEHVKADPDYLVEDEDALRTWLQTLMDTTIEQLDGTHFDIPPQIRRVAR